MTVRDAHSFPMTALAKEKRNTRMQISAFQTPSWQLTATKISLAESFWWAEVYWERIFKVWKSRVTVLWQNDYKSKCYRKDVLAFLDFHLVIKPMAITPPLTEATVLTISRTTLPDFLCEVRFCHSKTAVAPWISSTATFSCIKLRIHLHLYTKD